MKRKFLSTIVCLAIILIAALLLQNKVSAATTVASGTCSDNLTWVLDDTGTLTISGTGLISHNGSWDSYCDSITSVIISDGITSISNEAFYYCTNMTNITIPDSVTNIGYAAFYYCTNLTNITIPDSVTSIGASAFYNCHSLTSIDIPDSVTSIGSSAFAACSNLNSITIPNSIKNMSSIVSSDQQSLNYNIYDNGKYLGNNENPYIVLIDTISTSFDSFQIHPACKFIGASAFYNCHSLTSIDIPDSVTSIGESAFYNCRSLTSITIPNSITNIDAYAFYGCDNMNYSTYNGGSYLGNKQNPYVVLMGTVSKSFETFEIHSDTRIIMDNVFSNCNNLTTIVIPDNITYIGAYAFERCSNLTSIILPDSVTMIGQGAFAFCSKLTSISLPNSAMHLGSWVFYNCSNLISANIPDGITSIESGTFSDCSSLTNIVIPDSVTTIGNNAFSNCCNLTYISIPNNVTTIDLGAFSGCSQITSVTISANVAVLHWNSFSNCSSLTGIWVNENNIDYSSDEHGVLFDKNKTVLMCVPKALTGAYSIPDSVTSIEFYAFSNCTNITSIVVPHGITTFPEGTFKNCVNLTSVVIPNTVNAIVYSFINCTNLSDIYYCGTEQQWNSIKIDSNNDSLLNATLHYHNYSDSVVITKPTLTTMGQEQKTCTLCGDMVIEPIDMLFGNVHHWNITLEDDYAVNFFLQVSESIQNTAKVRITIGNDIVTYDILDLGKAEDGYFKLTANISAAQMNDFITIMVMNGREIGCNNTYTARQYCDTILADPKHSAYHALVKEMLNYGAMAQIYFDYDTKYLANDGITNVANAEVPETADEIIVSDKITNLNFYGASLVYRDRIAVRYYFKGDVTGCTFTVNDNAYTPVVKDGMYYVEIPDILPQNIDQKITLVVTHTDGSETSVTYNPMNYIIRMNAKGSVNLQNLLKALYNYHLAAKQLNKVVA